MSSFMISIVLCLPTALFMSITTSAQAQKIDDYPTSTLMRDSHVLLEKINPATGTSAQTLERYPNHLTMLIVRTKDGQSELHEHTADVFMVLDGTARLWTGGRMTDSKSTDKGEARGSGLEGGTEITLAKGDIVHIPANVPHQLRIAPGRTFTYFVVKVTEEK